MPWSVGERALRAQLTALSHERSRRYLEPVSRFQMMMQKCPSSSTTVAAMDVTISSIFAFFLESVRERAAYLFATTASGDQAHASVILRSGCQCETATGVATS